MDRFSKFAWKVAFTLGIMLGSLPALCQSYPSRPIQVILPFAAGTSLDNLARLITAKLTERLGWTFIHDNRVGGDGVIAMQALMRAPADGHTLLGSIASLTVIPTTKKGQLPYDPLKDVVPLTRTINLQSVLAAHPGVPANTLGEIIAYSKAHPGKLNFATASRGSSNHLLGELLKRETGLDMTNVPYKPGMQMQVDVMSGNVELVVVSAPTVVAYMPKVKPLVVLSERRFFGLPNVPAVGEVVKSLANVDMDIWGGLMVRAGTPREIVARLHSEIVAVLRLPEVQQQIVAIGGAPVIDATPDAAYKKYVGDIARWEKVIRESKLQFE
ncbi:MAG TPA: tripartite tricarboxylate transporter substrate-binding protein [Ramlibacter sp.]|nr:tripartite tricarboxylate transporter substrate-binding protein [Ramlibacter sp.]